MSFIVSRKTIATASLAAVLSFGAFAGAAMPAFASEAAADNSNASVSVVADETRTVTDFYGNEVTIPAEVDRVASTIGAFSQIAAMVDGNGGSQTVADIGRTNQTKVFQEVFPNSNVDDYDSSNIENLISADCQVAFGPAGTYSDEQLEQLEAANIAFVALGMRTVDDISNTALTIGEILGEEEYANAQAFVEYYKGWIEKATEATADIAEDEKPTVMQLRSSGGQYTTTNSSDICQAYFEAAGAVNVAADYSGEANGTALTVSAEQILEWNPQHIFVMYQDVADEIAADPALAEVDAVKNGNIHVIPSGTYYWSVRSGEGALMTPWLCSVLHPDLFPELDMVTEVKDFYQNFYGYECSDELAEAILNGTANNEE